MAAASLEERTTRYRTTAWSTRVELVVSDPGATVAAASILHAELDRMDRIANRFRPDSELNRVNDARTGAPVPVSTDLFDTLAVACRAAALTGGAVDPTVGDALCRIGYDRDFAEVSPGVAGHLPSPLPVPGWRSVELDEERSTVRVGAATTLDLGATAKALTADRVARTVFARTGSGVLVSLGGDMAVDGPADVRFVVGVADVCDAEDPPETVTIGPGGLATSGVGSRHWLLGRHPVHHLIDPRTGLPVGGPWRTVTVAAGSCVDANTASTASMVMGEPAPGWLAARGLPARLVRVDGRTASVGDWPSGRQG
jgi:thiamine biosynthesis lipoprotein